MKKPRGVRRRGAMIRGPLNVDKGIVSAPPPRSKREAVRRVLRQARRRLWALPANQRPAVEVPSSAVGLFTAPDMLTLARCRAWPLSGTAVRYLSRPPSGGRRERRRLAAFVRRTVRAMLIQELPAAYEFLSRRRGA
jgi:hypothetical protein